MLRWKKPVHDFIGSSIATDSNKFSIAFRVGVTNQHSRLSRRVGLDHFQIDSTSAQTIECRANQFSAASAACRRIDHRKEGSGIDHGW